jgi:hypothetical protein
MDPETKVELYFACLLVPLFVSTKKMEVIILTVSDGGGGLRIDNRIPEASLIYKVRHRWSKYLKKIEGEFGDSLKGQWHQPQIS